MRTAIMALLAGLPRRQPPGFRLLTGHAGGGDNGLLSTRDPLKAFLANPDKVVPGTAMPRLPPARPSTT